MVTLWPVQWTNMKYPTLIDFKMYLAFFFKYLIMCGCTVHINSPVFRYIYVSVCLFGWLFVWVCLWVCVCVYIYTYFIYSHNWISVNNIYLNNYKVNTLKYICESLLCHKKINIWLSKGLYTYYASLRKAGRYAINSGSPPCRLLSQILSSLSYIKITLA